MRKLGALFITCLVAISVAAGATAEASHDAEPCADVTLVFARGSGQMLGQREAREYFSRLADRLDGVSVNAYELGTEPHGGGQYPAVGISGSLQSYKNLLEAEWSWTGGLGGEYRASVASGVTEFTSFLSDRAARCPDEVAVGGYSQGAQTTGDAVAALEAAVRARIAHVALFGDPKLYLPEGRGPLPPACRGKEFSEWRRGSVSCWTDNGILEARKPYLPDDIVDRTGSWCDRNDPICNGNFADFAWTAHGEYTNAGAELDEAVLEAATAIGDALPDKSADFDLIPIRLAAGTDGLDVAFIIDTTGSMAGRIGAARATARELGQAVVDVGGRVALTEYRDSFDSFVARIRTPLTTDIDQYSSALDTLVASGGGDTPEALLTALMTTFNGLDWKDGATKAAVVLTDAGYHDPDRAQGWTLSDVVARSLEIDPVNVYPVVPSYLTTFYGPLAERTAGQVVLDSGNTQQALRDAFVSVTSRPVVFFELGDYVAAPGEEIRFAVDAYDVDASIDHFDWDVNGDGTVDATTTEPELAWSYATPWSGLAEVRAHSTDGGVGSAVANVTLAAEGLTEQLPHPPENVTAETVDAGDGTRTVTAAWDPATTGGPVSSWVVTNDEGTTVGVLDGAKLSHTVTGVPDRTVELFVHAVNAYGASGPAAVLVPGDTDPASELERLRSDVLAAELDPGTERSLVASLDAAIDALERGNVATACNQLGAFRTKLDSAAKQQKLSAEDRTDWQSRSDRISVQLDC